MTASIDPRLRQRRIAVRRAEGRRRLRVLLAALGLAGLIAGGYGLTRSALLDLDRVEVAGAFGSEADEVVAATGFELGTPMLDVDLDAAADAVTALPWVKNAEVARKWPATISVDVTRRLPIALLPTGDGGGVVIDEEGVAIARTVTAATGDLPVITVAAQGSLGDVQSFAVPALPVIEAVPADLVPWIETYGIEYDGGEVAEIVLELIGGARAELGIPTDVSAKLDAVRTTLGRVDLSCIEVIDVRIAELPLVFRCGDELPTS